MLRTKLLACLIALVFIGCGTSISSPTATITSAIPPAEIVLPEVMSTTKPPVYADALTPTTEALPPGVTLAPTPELVPFPVDDLTIGMHALVACGGNDPEYWFSVGPPDITPELAECILAWLEDN